MKFTETPLPGAWLVEPEPREDDRGSFARLWCEDEFRAHGLPTTIRQINESVNREVGTVRGMHWQAAPHAETKLVRCTRGRVFDVVVDLREGSPTRHRWHAAELSGEDGAALFVPEGFAHGYQVLEPDSTLVYLMGASYAPEAGRGFRFDDPAIGIEWPLELDPRLSARDAAWPALERAGT